MEQVTSFIREHRSFLIFTHQNPDGDALGSAFSLAIALRETGRRAVVVLMEGPAAKYTFEEFYPLYTLSKTEAEGQAYDACIAVDCADARRLGKRKDLFFTRPNLNLDHHISNTRFAEVNYVNDAPSTGEIIYDVMQAMDIPIGAVARMAIYIAISTDTGNFTYQNTTPKTLHICSQLVDAGLDISCVANKVYNCRSMGATRLVSRFIENLRLYAGGRLGLSVIHLADMEEVGAKVEDCEVLINYARDVDSVEIAAFIREQGKNSYKVSLRSKDGVDVSEFAVRFDGGGHKRAAGFMLRGNIHDVTQTVIKTAEEFLL
jgi:phosphoesterase RecJ-like protein